MQDIIEHKTKYSLICGVVLIYHLGKYNIIIYFFKLLFAYIYIYIYMHLSFVRKILTLSPKCLSQHTKSYSRFPTCIFLLYFNANFMH